MQPVESSQIAAIGHDAETNTLAVRFKNWKGVPTSLYHYRNFNAEDFAAFSRALGAMLADQDSGTERSAS